MRARTCLALHVDPAAQQFRQRLGDGRSQPSAAEATPATGLDLLERIEDPLPVRLRDADAGIAHREVQVRDVIRVLHLLRQGNLESDAPAFGELDRVGQQVDQDLRSEEHTSELQSLMRISYAVFCLKQQKRTEANTVKRVNI